jgi:hypothetical protein
VPCAKGGVIYCAFEGGHGYKNRIEALRRHYGITDATSVPLYVMPGKANLIKEHSALIDDFKNQLNGTVLACVVLDTLNRSLVGSENTEDMAEYTEAAEAIRAAFGCVVIIVHHCGYDPTHSRGHTSLPAAVDAELSVTRSEGSLYVAVTVKHMRDGPEGVVIRSRAETIPLDPDQNGKPRSSIVIVPDDNALVVGTGHRGRQDSATPTLATAMQTALAEHGGQFQPHGKMPVRAVEEDHIRKAFYRIYIDAENDKAKSADAQVAAFKRALKKLIADKIVVGQKTDDGKVMLWFAHAEENYR